MAKKKSKKKQQSPEAILKRAETLFAKKSYQAALTEYNKLDRDSIQEATADHLLVCEQATVAVRAKELLKKARRLLKKKKPNEALAYYEQVYDITREKQWADKKAELRAE